MTVLTWQPMEGKDRDTLEWHRGHTQITLIPAASQEKMHRALKSSLVSSSSPEHLQGEQESCRRKQPGSSHFAFCHCSASVQHTVCTGHFLLLPERLFCLALAKAGADFIPKIPWLWESGIMNMMESMKSKKTESQDHCCPDYAVLEQSHKWETPTPILRNVRLASHLPKNKYVSFITGERISFQYGFGSVG